MAICDAAANKKLDWVCVVTNDSDFAPAYERLIEAGKKVVWLCADDQQYRSKDLLSIVPADSAYCVDDLFERLGYEGSGLFESLFGRPGIRRAFQEQLSKGHDDPDKFFSSAPWDKSYREFQDEYYEAMEKEYGETE